MSVNDTLYVICSAAFYNDSAEKISLEMSLGIGLGLVLSLPALAGLIVLLQRSIMRYQWNKVVSLPAPLPKMPAEIVEEDLSKSALADFRSGKMTHTLMKEIMILRLKKGRNLDEYVKYAEQCKAVELANWISCLNPGEFPKDIHTISILPTEVRVAEELRVAQLTSEEQKT